MNAITFSFRTDNDFAEQTRELANILGLTSSAYIREAVIEKNERILSERIGILSKELAAEHLAFNESLESSLADGTD